MQSKANATIIQIRRGPFPRRVRGVKEKYELETRNCIEKALRDLMKLAEEAHKYATSKYQPTESRQKWGRLEAYIYQTINSLTKTYDSQRVLEKLEELTRIVEKHMEEDSKAGGKD